MVFEFRQAYGVVKAPEGFFIPADPAVFLSGASFLYGRETGLLNDREIECGCDKQISANPQKCKSKFRKQGKPE